MTELTFLKLGGSLITNKDRPNTPRPELIERLAAEIAETRPQISGRGLLLGHGSGSFGHAAAGKHNTRAGVSSPEGWQGFIEVWRAAAALNRIVLDALAAAGVPAVNFSPSGAMIAVDGRTAARFSEPIRAALDAGLVPVVHGDVVFDRKRGGTIFSTEDVFRSLAADLQPDRILIAGVEPGVWANFPENTRLIDEITPASYAALSTGIRSSTAVDVTGGMRAKVEEMLALAGELPGLRVGIFGGTIPGNIRAALLGDMPGTWIRGD